MYVTYKSLKGINIIWSVCSLHIRIRWSFAHVHILSCRTGMIQLGVLDNRFLGRGFAKIVVSVKGPPSRCHRSRVRDIGRSIIHCLNFSTWRDALVLAKQLFKVHTKCGETRSKFRFIFPACHYFRISVMSMKAWNFFNDINDAFPDFIPYKKYFCRFAFKWMYTFPVYYISVFPFSFRWPTLSKILYSILHSEMEYLPK